MINQDLNNHLHVYRYGRGIKLINPNQHSQDKHYDIGHTLETLLQLPLCIHFTDSNHKIKKINETTASICGFISAEDAIEKSMLSVSEKKSGLQVFENCNKVMTDNKTKIFEVNVIRKDQIINECISIKMPWYNNENKIMGVFGCTIVLGKQSIADSMETIAKFNFLNNSSLNLINIPHSPKMLLPGISIADVYLSKQEVRCLQLLITGKTSKLIGQALQLSARTVEHYLANIKLKLGVKTKAQLIEKVIQEIWPDILN
jgi:DNA-binding CsgD family transcriptional regulator